MLSDEQVKQTPIKYCVNAVRNMNQTVYEYRIFSRQLGDVCILVYANNIQEVLYYASPDSVYTPQPKREVTSLRKDQEI